MTARRHRSKPNRQNPSPLIQVRIGAALTPYLLGGHDALARKIGDALKKPRFNGKWGPLVKLEKSEAERVYSLAHSLRQKGAGGGLPVREITAASKIIGTLRRALDMPQNKRPRGGKSRLTVREPVRLGDEMAAEVAGADVLPETLAALAELAGEKPQPGLEPAPESVTVAVKELPEGAPVNQPANDLEPPPPAPDAPQVEHVAHHFQSALQNPIAQLEVLYFDLTTKAEQVKGALDTLRKLANA